MIKVIDTPSAGIKTTVTNKVGKYSIRGLRVGGPYTILILADDYVTKEFNNVHLQLDNRFTLSTTLILKSKIETIEVIGDAKQFAPRGSLSVFSEQNIEQSALVNRDIKDLVRRNPLAVVDSTSTKLNIAGNNPKYNSLTLDGEAVSDTFGLNANGYPAQRQPISANAISQISVEDAPFNVRASGFTSGTVDVVTKSGTNDFSGELFTNGYPLMEKRQMIN